MKRDRKYTQSDKGSIPKHQREPDKSALPIITPGRKRLFRLFAVLLVPALLLVVVETMLRLCGYGYSTHFFKPLRIGGADFLVENDKFGLRFFPPELARLPTPLRMTAHKRPGVCRIFILGESAAMGDPEPAFGAGRYLKVLLEERFPGREFEVVNVSMTAINSNVILPIARDCAREQGDLWLIYMGNNEMVGPFGAATVFGAQAPPLSFVRFNLALQRLRLGQFAAGLVRKIGGGQSHGPSWGGMQMFAKNRVSPKDPRRETVYHNFERNLQDIIRTGQKCGVRIVLSTVAVNLKDCPPFASEVISNLASAATARLEQLSTEASSLVARSNYAAAAEAYRQSCAIDPQSAALRFSWGSCLLRLTNRVEGCQQLKAACSLDALPFRADDRINQIITRTASERASDGLALCDAASGLATNSPGGVCGEGLFYEHVHLNFDGNYHLAKLWAEAVAHLLPGLRDRPEKQPALPVADADGWAPQALCEQRLGLTDWNRCNVLEEVIRRMQTPPLSEQINNSERVQGLADWKRSLQANMGPKTAEQAGHIYREALKRWPQDYRLHENFGDFLLATRDYTNATAQWEEVRDLIPQDHVAFFELGRLAALQTNWARAELELGRALTMRPTFSAGWFELGKVRAAQGDYNQALQAYDEALRYQPQNFEVYYYAGLALSKSQRQPQAIERYRQAVRLNPGFWEAHFELGGQLGLAGQFEEAKAELEAAVRLNPDFPMSHLNLGLALLKLRQFDAAEQQFQETLRLEPGNKLAPACLAQLQAARRRAQ